MNTQNNQILFLPNAYENLKQTKNSHLIFFILFHKWVDDEKHFKNKLKINVKYLKNFIYNNNNFVYKKNICLFCVY